MLLFDGKYKCECCGERKEKSDRLFVELGGFGVTGYALCSSCYEKIKAYENGELEFKEVVTEKTKWMLMESLRKKQQ